MNHSMSITVGTPDGSFDALPVGVGESSWSDRANDALDELRTNKRFRSIRTVDRSGVVVALEGSDQLVQYSSNDYFAMSTHPTVIAAAVSATERYGAGSASSRLVSGSRPIHDELEAALGEWKQRDALLFPTGYSANVGVLCALVKLGKVTNTPVAIVSDERNHASIVDGIRAAQAPCGVFRHGDVADAKRITNEFRTNGYDCVIVSDHVFSMDGNTADVNALVALANETGSLLVIDEAHCVFGAFDSESCITDDCLITVGTLSKSLGAIGGFVCGASSMIDWMRNSSRPSIFSTSIPPSAASAACAALQILRSPEGAPRIAKLRRNVDRLLPGHPSAVVPIVLGDEARTLRISAALVNSGVFVPAIRPPTVPDGTCRLRVSLCSDHTSEQLDDLVAALDAQGVSIGEDATAAAPNPLPVPKQ